MTDIPETEESTSGPLAWLIAIPVLGLVVAFPTVVFSALLLGVFLALDGVVGLPTVRLGALELVGIPAEFGLPILVCVLPAFLASLVLLSQTGLDWDGTDSSGDGPVGSRWR